MTDHRMPHPPLDVSDPVLGPHHKSIPLELIGRRASPLAGEPVPLDRFATPVLTLDRGALTANTDRVLAWARENGVLLAPHGKTTMAPALWAELLDGGAWGLTLATGWQARIARGVGVRRILIANEVVDPVALAELADSAPSVETVVWADSVSAVLAADAVFAPRGLALPVIVELGASGGRTGARSIGAALEVAEAIAAHPGVVLAGVGGYEGALAHDRGARGVDRVDAYLDDLAALHERLAASDAYGGRRPIVTAGGSAFPDRVVARLGRLAPDADVVLRCGAFPVHDDGFYAGISPFGREVPGEALRSAMHGWSRVLSRPEPGLALLDAGKRDLPFDEGLPTAQRVAGVPEAVSDAWLAGATVSALNDQHAFLALGPDATDDDLPVGSVVRLGLSHPCTALDHWRLVPLIEDADAAAPVVIGAVETVF